MIGKRFHFLVALERIGSDRYRCQCDCGNEVVAFTGNLSRGRTKSCGCWKKMTAALHNHSHGMAYSDEYRIWQGIRTRCKNQNSANFKNYGGAGITICERWDESFENFLADMGHRPSKGHSVDRKHNDGNYEPSNCRWATQTEQCNNTSRNVFITYRGNTMTTAEFANLTGFSRLTVYRWVSRDKLPMEEIERRLVARQKSLLKKSSGAASDNT